MTAYVVSNGVTSTGLVITAADTLDVLSGGTATSATIATGGKETVEVGGTDSGTTIALGGSQTVLGSATGDSVFGTQLVSNATAVVTNETVQSGGMVNLFLAGVSATNLTVLSGGALNLSGRVNDINTVLSGGILVTESAKATITGSLTFAGAATLLISSIPSAPASGSSYGDQAVISGFAAGDIVDDRVIGTGAVVAYTSAGSTLSAVITSGAVSQTVLFSGIASSNLALTADGAGGVELAFVACYCEGTRILTAAGEVAVEALRIGDLVVTRDGTPKPIRWLGRRSYAGRTLAGRRHVMPIRIKAGALGAGVPKRDLLVSPLHAMLIDGLLVPANALLNGRTIVREEGLTAVRYVHIELDEHDAIWAEGAASETFIDDDSRILFHNAEGEPVSYPGTAAYCAPRVDQGDALEAIRRRLAARARALIAA